MIFNHFFFNFEKNCELYFNTIVHISWFRFLIRFVTDYGNKQFFLKLEKLLKITR